MQLRNPELFGAPPEVRRSLWADINAANVSAGVTAGLWYAFRRDSASDVGRRKAAPVARRGVELVLRHLAHRGDGEHPADAALPATPGDHLDDCRLWFSSPAPAAASRPGELARGKPRGRRPDRRARSA